MGAARARRRDAIVEAALAKLAAPPARPVPIDEHAPFGDGNAADKIVRIVEQHAVGAGRA